MRGPRNATDGPAAVRYPYRKWWPALLFLASASGCAEELGPPEMVTAAVSGRVTLAGRPVPEGWLEFLPIDGTLGVLRSTELDADGTFRADRVPAGGKVAMRLVGTPLPIEFAEFGQAFLIRRVIPAEPREPIVLEIDLERERLRLRGGGSG